MVIPVIYPSLPSQKPLLTLITCPSTKGGTADGDDDTCNVDDVNANDDDDDDDDLLIF